MQETDDTRGGRRSAFAAAFLSFLFPGLGQAYARRYLRALAFAALPVLSLALLAGLLVNPSTRDSLLFGLASPTALVILLAINIGLLIYRVVAVVDAYRLTVADGGEGPIRDSARSPLRMLSIAGLFAVLLVLATGHYAVAQFNRLALDAVTSIGGGDEVPVGTAAPGATDIPPLPSESVATPGATDVATEAPTPVPTATQGPPWDGRERLNILLIGADRRENTPTYLTDTLIVASIDPQTRQVAMFSLPRDIANVPLPPEWPAARRFGGVYPNKINTLYTLARQSADLFPGNDAQRGYIAVKGALSQMYGIDIKYYVAVDFKGFLTVIDALGGVGIDVQTPVADDHYPTDDGRGALKLYIPPGIQYMDGPSALAYARSRHRSDDFTRAQRQQRVILSVRQQTDLGSLLMPGRLDALIGAFKNTVKTDFPPEDFPKLISLLQDVDLGQLRSLVFSEPTFATECYPCPPSGLYVLTPNVTAIREAIQRAFTFDPAQAERLQKLAAEEASVLVQSGTPGGKPFLVASFLADFGMLARNGAEADRTDYTQTVITVYNGAEGQIPETIAFLEETFGVEVQTAQDPAVTDDVVLITGPTLPELTPPL